MKKSSTSASSSSSGGPKYPAEENMAWHRDMNRRHGLGPGENGTSNVRRASHLIDAVVGVLMIALWFFPWCEIYRMSYRHFVQNAKQLAENQHIDPEIAYRASMLPSCDYGLQNAMKYYGYTYSKNSAIAWAISKHSKINMKLMHEHVCALRDGELPKDMSCWITLDEPWFPRMIEAKHRCRPIPYSNIKDFRDAFKQLILNDRFNWLNNYVQDDQEVQLLVQILMGKFFAPEGAILFKGVNIIITTSEPNSTGLPIITKLGNTNCETADNIDSMARAKEIEIENKNKNNTSSTNTNDNKGSSSTSSSSNNSDSNIIVQIHQTDNDLYWLDSNTGAFTYKVGKNKGGVPGKKKNLMQRHVTYMVKHSNNETVLQTLQTYHPILYKEAKTIADQERLEHAQTVEGYKQGMPVEANALLEAATISDEATTAEHSGNLNHYHLKEERMLNEHANDPVMINALQRDRLISTDLDFPRDATLSSLEYYEIEKWNFLLKWNYETHKLANEKEFRAFVLAGIDFTGGNCGSLGRMFASGIQNHFNRAVKTFGSDHN